MYALIFPFYSGLYAKFLGEGPVTRVVENGGMKGEGVGLEVEGGWSGIGVCFL